MVPKNKGSAAVVVVTDPRALLLLACAALKPIHKLQHLHSKNSARTTEIYLKS